MEKQLTDMQKWGEELRKDPVRLKAFLREIMGPPHRTLEGKEHEEIWFLLQLMLPVSESNNQHSWTHVYEMSGNKYHVTWFPNNSVPTIDEYLPEEN